MGKVLCVDGLTFPVGSCVWSSSATSSATSSASPSPPPPPSSPSTLAAAGSVVGRVWLALLLCPERGLEELEGPGGAGAGAGAGVVTPGEALLDGPGVTVLDGPSEED